MTQEVLNALTPGTGEAEAARSAETEGLSSRTSPQAGAAIRPPETGEERIATPVTRSLVRNDRETKETGEERIATASVRTGFAMTGEAQAPAPGGPGPDSAFLREHFARLSADCAALARELPDFDPAAALRDPAFLRLTAPGLGVEARSAWLALHPETLQRRAAEALGRAIASGAARPREGGRGGALPETDYRSLPRAEQQRLKQRIYDAAALGEKIYP